MFNVKEIWIQENLVHNDSSKINFLCNASKLNFTRLIKSQSMRPLFFDGVDFEKFEIKLQLTCISEDISQKVSDVGYVLMNGNFFHQNDGSYTYLNLSTEVNQSNWLKLKSDLLFVENAYLQFLVSSLIFNEVIEDVENDYLTSDVEASFESYRIIKSIQQLPSSQWG
jgi:hypothetical protein